MKPHVLCLMLSSVGRLHASKWTTSPDGTRSDWSTLYEEYQDTLRVDAWLVGRTTMAEMSKAQPHPVSQDDVPARPVHRSPTGNGSFAIAVDTSGALHFDRPAIHGNHVVVVLGAKVPDDRPIGFGRRPQRHQPIVLDQR